MLALGNFQEKVVFLHRYIYTHKHTHIYIYMYTYICMVVDCSDILKLRIKTIWEFLTIKYIKSI